MSIKNINGIEYEVIDTKEITITDCFVAPSNKIGRGSGESMLYIGQEGADLREFFNKKGFKINCFLLKQDFIKYLEDCKEEYIHPEQNYNKKKQMHILFKQRLTKVQDLPDLMSLVIYELDYRDPPRVYVHAEPRNKNTFYNLIREISLPNITYLAIMKLKSKNNEILYYLKLFVDYFGETENKTTIKKEIKKIEKSNLPQEDKFQLTKARIGQGKYREKLLEQCPFCPITLVSDDRLLIASHIKPWAKSNNNERIDPKNGFMFTPTFDFLFDRGFITFSDDKKMFISPWLSKMTCSKLNIVPDKKYDKLPIEGRESYLQYHRKNIYKG